MSRLNTRKNGQFGFCYYLPVRFSKVFNKIAECVRKTNGLSQNKEISVLTF